MRTIPLVLIICATTPLLAATTEKRPAKPNIVLVLTDDLGWQDV